VTGFEIVADGFQFAEAPRVDDDDTVCWSDLLGGGYYRKRPGGPVETMLAGRRWIGGAVLDEGGGVVLGGEGGLVLVSDGQTLPLLEGVAGRPIIAVNDIEGDGRGGLFGGTIDFVSILERGETPQPGLFFHLAPSGTVTVLRDDVAASNGIGFSPDGRWLYHAESTVGIWRWAMGADGLPHTPELLVPADDCDGLAVDIEGGIWVAFWQEAQIRRFRPDGSTDRTITLPFAHLISLAFGGADMRDLYITTGGDEAHPGTGGVVRIRTDIAGLPAAKCRLARAIA
jgi:sugar lactone lactonase YvrE